MSKYKPLADYLSTSDQHDVRLCFAEIEDILGFMLPYSATRYAAWWSNHPFGHSHAKSWLNAGYKAAEVNLSSKTVCFQHNMPTASLQSMQQQSLSDRYGISDSMKESIACDSQTITIQDHDFIFLQTITPQYSDDGTVITDCPDKRYSKSKNSVLLPGGNGPFCRFFIDCHDRSGVYLWVVDKEIIYIGETINIRRRFNDGYGHISPRNCFKGGQSTNCKMNSVVLDKDNQGKTISIYVYETKEYKRVERELLEKINTPYNKKNNP